MSRVVAVLVVAALVLGGGGLVALSLLSGGSDSSSSRPAVVSSPSPVAPQDGSQEAPEPGLQHFYEQRLDWQRCRSTFWCATLEVPLDYAKPAGRTLELALLQAPATGTRIGSLVVNPGGPGAPGTEYAAASARAFGDRLRRSYDIVGFDPRGTGRSEPVDCLSDAQLTDYLAADPDPDTPQEEQAFFASAREIGTGCVKRSGELAAHISTQEAARDMDVLRAALGERELTYFGASYGTKLGAVYASLFPRRVGRFVLDGAVDPVLGTRELNLQQAAGFETALRAYVANCVKDSDCFLGPTVDAGVARIKSFLDGLDAEPLKADGGRELTEGEAFLGLAFPLYSRDYWVLLSTALRSAFAGDGSALLMLADAYASRSGSSYQDNSMEALYAINCLDDPWALRTPAEVEAQVPAFEKASPTFGRSFAWMSASCAGLQVPAKPAPTSLRVTGTNPIVVIGTTRDPATPLAWAKSLAREVDGRLIVRDGDGHTGYNAGNACVDEAVEGYLVDGDVPPAQLGC